MKSGAISKRRFLATTAAATAAICSWTPFTPASAAAGDKNRRINLNGAWKAAQEGKDDWITATVPGCIHTDLIAAGKIPDPFFGDNEQKIQWVGEAGWTFKRTFKVPNEILKSAEVLLRCEGLDTLALIRVNDREVGRADNMFRTWEFDVKPALKSGDNSIEISFASVLPYMKERQAARVLYEWAGTHEPRGRAWVRKEPCNFGWDWGPVVITCGIWRNISILALDTARIADVQILQDHSAKGKVGLQIEIDAHAVREMPLKAAVTVSYKGRTVQKSTTEIANKSGRCSLEISDPKLWWPAGMGEAALYDVSVELTDSTGALLDQTTRRIGLRTLKLIEQTSDRPMRFEVNGIPFFAKGANWIPADAFANRVTPEILRRYVADAVSANMNMLRFWGGGYYEEDALFDACDEMGICVWLDFKFACSSYPAFDDPFMQSVRHEARDNLLRLRHHPSIAAWCGNNEISLMVKDTWTRNSMGRADYDKLFKDWLGGVVKEFAPQANYVSGSPDCGDVHFWGVWHGGKNFEEYRTLTGFLSEFGFQSFPEPRSVRTFTTEKDRESLISPVMQWHQRSPRGNEKIRDMIPHYFKPPKDFESSLWLSQILQGYGIKLGAEFWRQDMIKSSGCVFWQYNDCWPVTSWSSVDYFGRWKALQYMARRFYAPLLVSGREDAKNNSVDIFLSSDRLDDCRGVVSWTVTDSAGKVLSKGSDSLSIAPRQSKKVKTLDLRDLSAGGGVENLLVWLNLDVDGKSVSENLVTLAFPKDLNLVEPGFKTSIATVQKDFVVTVSAEKPALWTWLSLDDVDARYSDNFFHVTPGNPVQVRVTPAKSMSKSQFTKSLRVRSLFDTHA